MKEKYIIERPSKHGLTYQVKIRQYGASFSQTIHADDFPTKKQALAYAKMVRDKQLVTMKQNSRNLPKDVPTIQELYNKKWELNGLSIKTRKRHDAAFNIAFVPYKNKRLSDITITDIQQSLVKYAEDHTQGQVNRAKTVWKQLYDTAFLLGFDVVDLTPRLSPIRSKVPTNHRSKSTDPITLKLFFEKLSSYGDPKMATDMYYMLMLMYYTGCRIAEVLAISKSDYNPSSRTLHIQKMVGSTASNTRMIVTTKTEQSNRFLPLSADACALIERMIEYSSTDPLLTDADGRPYEITKVSTFIRNVSLSAGIQFNAYRLRHLFSTDLLRSGESLAVIRDLMGHSSTAMSLDYAISSDEEMKEAINKLSGQVRDKKVSQ